MTGLFRSYQKQCSQSRPHLLDIYSHKNPLPLSSYSFGSGKIAIWECKEGHPDYEASVKNKVNGNDCPYCTGKLVAPQDSLAYRFPELAREWDSEKNGFGPDEISYGSSAEKHWWRCRRFNHAFEATVNNRTSGTPCPKCPKVGSSLAEVAPELETQWLVEKNGGLLVAEIPAGRKTKYWWCCANNSEHPDFQASPANMCSSITKTSKGCNVCRRQATRVKPVKKPMKVFKEALFRQPSVTSSLNQANPRFDFKPSTESLSAAGFCDCISLYEL